MKTVSIIKQQRALRRKSDAAAAAIKECETEFFFEGLDLSRDRRLREPQLFRGAAKVQLARDDAEYLEAKIFHAAGSYPA